MTLAYQKLENKQNYIIYDRNLQEILEKYDHNI